MYALNALDEILITLESAREEMLSSGLLPSEELLKGLTDVKAQITAVRAARNDLILHSLRNKSEQ